MKNQAGFSLFELMIAIAVIAILTAIAIPTYQNYIQKAATTEMLQTMTPIKTAVELCVLEENNTDSCNTGSNGISTFAATRYVDDITVATGIITIKGKSTLNGLTAILTPKHDPATGSISWKSECSTNPDNNSLTAACQSVFKFQ